MKSSFASCPGWPARQSSADRPESSAIIPFLASNSPFLMFVGALRLKQSALSILLLTAASVILVSCGNNYNQNQAPGTPTEANPATIRVHVFVSNPLFPVNTSTLPVLNVVDGQRDLLSPGVVSVGATSTSPGTMVIFPNKRFSFVFS